MDTEQVDTINKKIFQLDVSEHSSKPDRNHIEPKTTVYTPMQTDVSKLYNINVYNQKTFDEICVLFHLNLQFKTE